MGENHTITLENQKRLTAVGVSEVDGFSETEIRFTIVGGKKVTVCGQNMKITDFAKESGRFVAEGVICKISYHDGKNIFKRLIK